MTSSPSNSPIWARVFTCALLLAGIITSACTATPESTSEGDQWSMPSQTDQIHLSWIAGPPQMQVFQPYDSHLKGFREDAAVLSFRSEKWGMLIDPIQMKVDRFTLQPTSDAVNETLAYTDVLSNWSQSLLEMRVEVRGKIYRVKQGKAASEYENNRYSPIHIVESGTWFQHVAIYDFDLVADSGEKLEAKTWLEIRAWGDKCLFEWFVIPEQSMRTKLAITLSSRAAGFSETAAANGAARVQLGVGFDGGVVRQLELQNSVKVAAKANNDFTPKQPDVLYSDVTDAWEVRIPRQKWPRAKSGAAFNLELLDRISSYDLVLENVADEPRDVCLRFIHDYHPVAGYVPMILDEMGQQTGLPLQNSKNWHSLPEEPYPYEGTWINITARLTLAPKSQVDFEYIVAHALWQGVPASSAAQLSLVGWGYNGFWTQMALGAWGETVCIQPGRTMRRAFITDVRPFEVLSQNDLPYDWTTNVGGGDVARVTDADGKYVPWLGTVRQFERIGPNLSHVNVVERSPDEKMRLSIDTYLPRSNSIHRSYFTAKLEFLNDVELSDLALFQLASDYYNEMESQKIAWGNADTLLGEQTPPVEEWGTVVAAQPLSGEQPWVSLFANTPDTETRGRGVRGIVLRHFRAQINGETYNTPHVRAGRTMSRLNAELVLPDGVTTFKAGDFIEWTVELDAFPLTAEAYYGSNKVLKERLAATPDSWELIAFESRFQGLQVNGQAQVFPATYQATDAPEQSIRVSSTSSMETIIIQGLGQPDTWKIMEVVDGASNELGARFSAEAKPQIDYDPDTKDWSAVLSLIFSEGAKDRAFVLKVQ
ncbi:MAG: hypothetical protein ACSHX4_10760 [Opitutaceae bacterium]